MICINTDPKRSKVIEFSEVMEAIWPLQGTEREPEKPQSVEGMKFIMQNLVLAAEQRKQMEERARKVFEEG